MVGLRVAMLAATLMLLVLMGVSVSNVSEERNNGAAMGRRVAARRFLAAEGITRYIFTSNMFDSMLHLNAQIFKTD